MFYKPVKLTRCDDDLFSLVEKISAQVVRYLS